MLATKDLAVGGSDPSENALTLTCIEQVLRMLSYLATPVVAVAAVWIAYQQMRIAHRKLQTDQYERRLRIYEEIRKLLSIATAKGDLRFEDLLRFRTAVSEADFLFGPEVMKYIDELYKRGCDLGMWNEMYRTPVEARAEDYNHHKVVESKYRELRWLTAQYEPARNVFKKYLDIS
jgi:hypothetical protein